MEHDEDSQPTQATQTLVDPRRLGKQNSGFSDQEIADIICILYPKSDNARRAVAALESENSKHLVSRPTDSSSHAEYLFDDDASRLGMATAFSGERVIALKLSSTTKDPAQGFVFGRHQGRCDICLTHDPHKRLSNTHFRIFLNEYGVLMLEDTSTNGTIVDQIPLKKATPGLESKRTLSNGSQIEVSLHSKPYDLIFLVQVPKREGQLDVDFKRNVLLYRQRLHALTNDEEALTMVPGPDGGPPVLFPNRGRDAPARQQRISLPIEVTEDAEEGLPREWNGSSRYNRIGQIGKGAFATVHKVTSKYDGRPYAAKELDKRRFMKNGVLDQKVENEMKIMRSVTHPNIVCYVDHFEWDNRLLIIIMEFVPYGDLGGFVQRYGPLPEQLAIETTRQLVSALGYLHSHNITHRDVKPDNILIQSRDPFTVKLTDFGLSKMVDNEQTFLRTFCGTLLYCAPEVYSEYSDYDEHGRRQPRQRRQIVGQRYDHAVDLYSLGGVLYYTLTGKPPYPVDSGTSYAHLLNKIMTQPLDVAPLEAVHLSSQGIDCLRWMMWRRPEHRATVRDVEGHQWLGGSNLGFSRDSQDASSEELGFKASQLSLADNHVEQALLSDDEIMDEEDELMDLDYQDLNQTWSQNQQPGQAQTFGQDSRRLFGEVNASAVGSSGVIPEDRLNISLGDAAFSLDSDIIKDSFSSDATQDRQPEEPENRRHSSSEAQAANAAAFEANKAVTAEHPDPALVSTEDLDPSLSRYQGGRSESVHDLNASKRLRSYETSDEMPEQTKPSFKRVKSDSSLDEDPLIASVPPLTVLASGRQINDPVPKSIFWSAEDRTTWHLNYPEMTQLQHDAFTQAAKARNEEFGPESALWRLAMQFFPPTPRAAHSEAELPDDLGNGRCDDEVKSNHGTRGTSATGTATDQAGQATCGLVVPLQDKRLAARFESAPGSLVENISIPVEETFASFGRADDNTQVYGFRKEVKVPKHAFKLVLWKPGFDASRNFRPWSNARVMEKTHFYIATKATNGIRVNGHPVPSHDAKNPTSPCRHWVRLHDGDTVMIWGDDQQQAKLLFRCFLSDSREPRAEEDWPAVLASEMEAAKLDEACTRAERRFPQLMETDRLKAAERQDYRLRKLAIAAERKRSEEFYRRRDALLKSIDPKTGAVTPITAAWTSRPVSAASRRLGVGSRPL